MQAQLTHYHILEQIGAGGMGVVYRAHEDRLDRDVALKVLPPGTILDASARKRFRKEALALSRLNHPNIATILDFDSENGTDFLVEELIEGCSLDTMLESGPLSEREILHLGSQLAEGVAAAHDRDILHRDLKPANIRITQDARLKILDFGLATILRGEMNPQSITESLSETHAIAGTLPYMAPEQLLGEKLDARTDIWAIGCVFYEMATGHRPFSGTGTVLTDAILHRTVPPPATVNPRTSPGLQSIILKCLEKDPALRYQATREILADLRRLATSVSSPAVPVVKKRSRVWFLIAGVSAVVLIVASVAGVWYWRRSKNVQTGPPTIAVLPFVDMSPTKDQEYFSDGLADELINDLAKIPEMRVTARTSSFQFKGKNEDLRSIGQKLNVTSILEGSVRKDADRIRITVQLINVRNGFHIWSETYDRNITDIFAVQEEIARSVANELRVTLLPGRIYSPKPTTPEAYNAYLQGRSFQQKNTTEDIEKAAGYYRQAIGLDPSFAPAWAWLGSAYYQLAGRASIPTEQGFQKAREAAEQALKLDPQSADAHRVLGNIKLMWDWDWHGADVELRRAVELEPNNVYNLSANSTVSLILGRCTDALQFARRSVELNPTRAAGYTNLSVVIWNCGNLDEAVAVQKKALEMNPNAMWAHYTLGKMYYQQGKLPEALAMIEQEVNPGYKLLGLTLVYDKMGERQKSDAALQELIDKYRKDYALQIAEAYGCRNESDNAVRWLQTAYDQHDTGLNGLTQIWCFRSIESDPTFQRIRKKMNLPESKEFSPPPTIKH